MENAATASVSSVSPAVIVVIVLVCIVVVGVVVAAVVVAYYRRKTRPAETPELRPYVLCISC